MSRVPIDRRVWLRLAVAGCILATGATLLFLHQLGALFLLIAVLCVAVATIYVVQGVPRIYSLRLLVAAGLFVLLTGLGGRIQLLTWIVIGLSGVYLLTQSVYIGKTERQKFSEKFKEINERRLARLADRNHSEPGS